LNATVIIQLLNLIIAGTEGIGRAIALKQQLEQFQAENNRDPTQAEWDALFSSIDIDSARIDAADDRLNPPSV
jgi:hypothetical protein